MVKSNHARMMTFLADGQWHKAAEIWQVCGGDIGFQAFSRELRAMAEETGAFIGGQEGYKRADLATAEELEHAGKSLCSRGSKTTRRGQRYIRQAKVMKQDLGPLFARGGCA